MANYITISRILLIFPVLILASPEPSTGNWVALILFVVAGVTDHLDGYIARKTNTTSSLGALLDLLADKLLVCIVLVYLVSISGDILLTLAALIIIAREIFISYLRQYLSEKEENQSIKVNIIGKIKTTLQIIALSFLIISPNFGPNFYFISLILIWISAYASLYSLLRYLKNYKNLIK